MRDRGTQRAEPGSGDSLFDTRSKIESCVANLMRLPVQVISRKLSVLSSVLLATLLVPASALADYRLAPGDVLEIRAITIPNLRQRAMIDSNGQASFALLGEIDAAGLTLGDLRAKIRTLLPTKVIRVRDTNSLGNLTASTPDQVITMSPDELTVTVAEYRPIYLNGDVAKPGAQTYRPGMTVRQAIALAGGYDTMRFRGRDPFLESSDFRSEYYGLWAEFAKIQVQIARINAELEERNTLNKQTLEATPLPTSVTSPIQDVKSKRLDVENLDRSKEKRYLADAIAKEDNRISVLMQQQQKEQQDASADATDFQEI